MIIFKTIQVNVKGQWHNLYFGRANTPDEIKEVYALRYKVYAARNYIEPNTFPDQLEFDSLDTGGKCTYFIAKFENKMIGAIRLIEDTPLPTEKFFAFTAPKTMEDMPHQKRCELSRFVIIPPAPEDNIFLPRGLVMLFLINTLCLYGLKHNLSGGYAFIKKSLEKKMDKLRMPYHKIAPFTLRYPKDGVMYNYFHQEKDPVIPIYYVTDTFFNFTESIIRNRLFFKTINTKTLIMRSNIFTRFFFSQKPPRHKKNMNTKHTATDQTTHTTHKKSRLDSRFWNTYFGVYDYLNNLIPYQELMETIIRELALPETKSDTKGSSNSAITTHTILDAGSGTGNLAVRLHKMGHRVVGIDASLEGIGHHKRKNPHAEVHHGDLTQPLPFEDAFFDRVASNNTIYTLPREKRDMLFKEFHRVLKPGGHIVISNIAVGFAPIKIYNDHIRKSLARHGALRTFLDILRLSVPTLRIFYYNYLIKREHTAGTYGFVAHDEQRKLFLAAGFTDIGDDIPVYGNQALLTKARKADR